MKSIKDKIEWAISDTGRKGYENVISWLNQVNFYETPASIKWHNNFRGGLAKHSWEVFQEALKDPNASSFPLQSIVICSLLHDVCKYNQYSIGSNGESQKTSFTNYRKHGLSSVEILESLGLLLHEDEKQAIWWHMGEYEPSKKYYPDEYKKSLTIPLCQIIRDADYRASHSWYADQWLAEFGEAKQSGDTHFVRQEVFNSTLCLVNGGAYISPTGRLVQLNLNPNALHDNVFCEHEVSLINPINQYDTIVSVVKQDCLSCAHDMLKADATDDLCVLNMASSRNPGGGVLTGAGAQEEYLFRCSDYFRFLYQYASTFDSLALYNIPHNPQHCYPLGRYGGIYSHGVTIFRDVEANGYQLIDDPWRVNFVAVAAHRLSYKVNRIPLDKVESTIRKIRAILRIAYNNGQRRLVLGAFGCGAFHNPPGHMAELFKQVLGESEFEGLFREIRFAIIEDHNSHDQNYKVFASVFQSS